MYDGSMILPPSPRLNTKALGRLFQRTTASYKFYWFLSLLDAVVETGKPAVSADELSVRMVSLAWFPVHFFKLSFGKCDNLGCLVHEVQRTLDLPIKTKETELRTILSHRMREDESFRKSLRQLLRYVPYQLLSPWTGSSESASKIIEASAKFETYGALYALIRERGNLSIRIHDEWMPYLIENYAVLRDFAFWNLLTFVQQRNPHVPNVSAKLVRPDVRNSLSSQKRFWDQAIEAGADVHCIYTGTAMHRGAYALDHFLPWSFVAHDQLWNLTPSDASINSSKSDKLPILDCFLEKLVVQQQEAVKAVLKKGREPEILDDFLSIGLTPAEIVESEFSVLMNRYIDAFEPLERIAINTGFEVWQFKG